MSSRVSRSLFFSLLVSLVSLSLQAVAPNPNPGENLWQLTGRIGHETNTINSKIDALDESVKFTVVDSVDNAVQSLGYTISDLIDKHDVKICSKIDDVRFAIGAIDGSVVELIISHMEHAVQTFTSISSVTDHVLMTLTAIDELAENIMADFESLNEMIEKVKFTVCDKAEQTVTSLGFTICDKIENAQLSLAFTIVDALDADISDAVSSLGFTVCDKVENAQVSLAFTIVDTVENNVNDAVASLGFTISDAAQSICSKLDLIDLEGEHIKFTVVDSVENAQASLGFTMCDKAESIIDEINTSITTAQTTINQNTNSVMDAAIESLGFTVCDKVENAQASLGFTICEKTEAVLSAIDTIDVMLSGSVMVNLNELKFTICDKAESIIDEINTSITTAQTAINQNTNSTVDAAIESLGFTVCDKVENAQASLGFTICEKTEAVLSAIDTIDVMLTGSVMVNLNELKFTICDKAESIIDEINTSITTAQTTINQNTNSTVDAAIESLGFTICDKVESAIEEINTNVDLEVTNAQASLGFTIADAAQSICSKLDLIDIEGDDIKFTVVDAVENAQASLGFTICEKIEQATLCNPTAVTTSTTIATSGHYCLANDITGDVLISGNNVTLDLNGYTVSGGTNGIIVSGDENTVHGGTVRGATASGISVTGDKNRLENLDLVASTTGVELTNANANTIENVRALCNSSAGFSLVSSQRNCVINCKAVDNGDTSNAFGFVSTDGMCNLFDGCIAENTKTTGVDPFFAAGFMLTGTEQKSKIKHCQASNTNAISDAFGILLRGLSLNQLSLDILISATFDHGSGGTAFFNADVTSLDWLACNGTKYLAIGGFANAGPEVRVLIFNEAADTLSSIVSATFEHGDEIDSVAWQICNSTKYLAIGGRQLSPSTAHVRVLEFDASLETLAERASIDLGTDSAPVFALDWLVCNGTKFLAAGGDGGGLSGVNILRFDPPTTLTKLTTGFSLDKRVQAVAWQVCDGTKYLAIGSDGAGPDDIELRVLEFNPATSALSQVGTATFKHTSVNSFSVGVNSVDWLTCDDSKYIAMGGVNGFDGTELRVLKFNATAGTLTRLTNAERNTDIEVRAIQWLTCNGIKYLAASENEGQVNIFAFDVASETLSDAMNPLFSHGALVESIDWLRCGNSTYLAIGGNSSNTIAGSEGADVRILEFNGCKLPKCNIIKKNHVDGSTTNDSDGVGVQDDSALTGTSTNHIYSNFSCKNDINYNIGTQFPISSAQSKGVGETENIDCALEGTDDFEEIKFTVADSVENAQASLGFTICEKIKQATLCDPTAITTPTIISLAGHYCLANDIAGDILITTSNVVLDLNNHSITASVHGVEVTADNSNVTVQNGTIKGASAEGILVNSGCDNVMLMDLKIRDGSLQAIKCITSEQCHIERVSSINCDKGAVLLDHCNNCVVKDAQGLSCTSPTGDINVFEVLGTSTAAENIHFIDCLAADTIASDGIATGFRAQFGRSLCYERCSVKSLTASSRARGFRIDNTNDLVLDECVVSKLQSVIELAYGVRINTCTDVVVKNSSMLDIEARIASHGIAYFDCSRFATLNTTIQNIYQITSLGGGNAAFGIRIEVINGPSSEALVNGCTVQNITSPVQSEGIRALNTTNVVVENCTVQQIAGAAFTRGIAFLTSSEVKTKECIVQEVSASAGEADGILSERSPDTIIEDCNIQHISGTSFAFGALVLTSTVAQVKDCDIQDISASAGTAGGVVSQNSPDTIIGNCNVQQIAGTNFASGVLALNSAVAKVKECEIQDISASAGESRGVRSENSPDTIIEDCNVQQISGTSVGLGISGLNSSDVRINNCTAQNISGALSIGTELVNTSSFVISNCVNMNVSGDNPFGINIDSGVDGLIKGCESVGIFDNVDGGDAVGIRLFNASPDLPITDRVCVINCVSKKADIGFDVRLSDTLNVDGILVKECIATHCASFGFRKTVGSAATFVSNQAYDNGTNFSTNITNVQGLGSTPIKLGTNTCDTEPTIDMVGSILDKVCDLDLMISGSVMVDLGEVKFTICDKVESAIEVINTNVDLEVTNAQASLGFTIADAAQSICSKLDLIDIEGDNIKFTVVDAVDNAQASLSFTISDLIDKHDVNICSKIDDVRFAIGAIDGSVVELIISHMEHAVQTFTSISSVTDHVLMTLTAIDELAMDIMDNFTSINEMIEKVKFTVCDKAEQTVASLGFTICDKTEAVLSAIDTIEVMLTGSVMIDLGEIKFTICDKIEQATLCNPTAVTASTTIATSGHYCLANDITGNVLISGNNVTLDLNGYTISGGTNGITVSGDENTVHNGTVRGATASSISVTGGKNRLKNLDLIASTTGVELVNANTNTIENCRALCNTSAGFSLVSSNRNCAINCKAVDNGDSGNAFGFVSTDGMCNIFDGCIAENTKTTGVDPFFAAGFMLTGAETNSKIKHCQAENTCGGNSAFGVLIQAPTSFLALDKVVSSANFGARNSVAWQVCDGNKYIASFGLTQGVVVQQFDPDTNTLGTPASNSSFTSSNGNIDWRKDSKLLVVGGATSPEVRVFEFDPTGLSVNSVSTGTFMHGAAVNAVKWLVCEDISYVAVGGDNSVDGAEVRVIEFDTTTSVLSQVGSATFEHGGLVFDVDWLVSDNRKFIAIGGGAGAGGEKIRVLEFDTTNSTLNEVDNFIGGGSFFETVRWQVCNNTKYLATGESSGTVRVFTFDPTSGILAPVTTANVGADVTGLDWLVCSDNKYIGTSSRINDVDTELRVLQFDPTAPSLTQVANNGFASFFAFDVAWQLCSDRAFMAAAEGPGNVRVLEFNGCAIPACNIIKNNHVSGTTTNNTSGVGIQDDAVLTGTSTNHIYSNFSCKNDTNYNIGTQFPISPAQSKGVGETENIDCALDGVDPFACNPTAITGPTTIATSGHYCLANDITGNVLISGNNVTLDLNGYTISGGTNGITVSGDENTVHNGTVRGATASSISVTGDKNRLENLDLIASTTGVELVNANTNTIENCRALCNTSAGFSLVSSNRNCVINCKAVDNGDSSNAFGFVSTDGMCNIFDGCIAENTKTTGVDPFFAAGFLLTGTETKSKIKHCQAENTSGINNAFGIRAGRPILLTDIAQFNHGAGDAIQSVAWHTCNGRNLLAIGGVEGSTAPAGNEVRVLEFDCVAGTLTDIAQFNHGASDTIQSVAWHTCDGREFLAIGGFDGFTAPAGNEVRILEFDCTNSTLTDIAQFNHGFGASDRILSVAWYTCGDREFLAIGGFDGSTAPAGNEVRVLEFDCTNSTLTDIAQFNHTSGDLINSLAWHTCNSRDLLAIGGQRTTGDLSDVRVLEFNCTASTLTEIAKFNSGSATIVSVAWHTCNSRDLLAIGGLVGSDGNHARVLEFDCTNNTLTDIARFDFGTSADLPFSVAWRACSGRDFLAIGGKQADAGSEVRVLEFDCTANTLTEVVKFDHGVNDTINEIAWYTCNDRDFLAIGGDEGDAAPTGNEVRILEFSGCQPLPQCNIIKKNHVSGVTTSDNNGVGIQDGSALTDKSTNQIYSNFSCKNDVNYNIGTQFPISPAQSKGVGETENIDCALGGINPFACNPLEITSPTTIAVSGHYCLANDISGNVLISGNNVTFDLNGYTISGGINGITISGDEAFVHNGTIRGTSAAGIRIEGNKNKIENIDTIANATGMELVSADSNCIDNCRALCNTSAGFSLEFSSNNVLTNNKAIDNGDGGNAFGFVSKGGMCNLFDGCIAKNTHTSGADLFFAAGFMLTGTETKSKIKHCQTENIIGINNAFGIRLGALNTLTNIAPFDHGLDEAILSVAWHTCNGRNFLAIGGTEGFGDNEVRVLEFDCVADTFTDIAQFSHGSFDTINSVAWHTCDGKEFLAIGGVEGNAAPAGNEVRVLEFDCTNSTLTDVAQFNHGASNTINSVAWHTCGGREFLAIGGVEGNAAPAGNEVRVLEFDCTNSTLTDIAQFNHGASNTINSVAWHTCDSREFLAIGGVEGSTTPAGNEVRVLEFDCTNSTLTDIAQFNHGAGDTINEVAWHTCNGKSLLAIGGVEGSTAPAGNEVRVLEFDCTNSTLTDIAQFNNGASDTINSVAWYSCNSKNFLAIGGIQADDGNEVRVLEFDCANSTLTKITQINHGSVFDPIHSVAWYNCNGKDFLAIGGVEAQDGIEVRVLEFDGCQPPQCSIIKKNHVSGVTTNDNDGVGIQDDFALTGTSTNHIYSNFSCKNDTNYNIGTQFPISPAQSKGVGETENIDCALDGVDPFACNPTAITDPTTIATSGHYCLANDITGNVLISGNNVTLDLNGYTISGGTNGITVSGDENTVHNGTVRGATASSISVTGDKNRLENLDLIASTTGVELVNANTNTIENCRALCNTSAGFSLVSSNRNCAINCKAVDNGDSGNAFGFVSTDGMCNIFDGCIAENTKTTGVDPFFAAGFVLTGTEQKSKIVHSQASNTSGTNNAFGILLTGISEDQITLDALMSATFNHGLGLGILSVAWQVCGTSKYLAIGGSGGGTSDGAEVRVLKFDDVAQTLSQVGSATFDHTVSGGELIQSVAWQVCGTSKYLAIGGGGSGTSDGAEVRVLKFDDVAQTLSQVGSATFDHTVGGGELIQSVAWQVCGTSKYLAIGGSGFGTSDGAEVRVLQFDPDAQTLSQVGSATFDHGRDIQSVAWQVCGDSKYLAIGGGSSFTDGAEVRVLKFDDNAQTLSQVGTATFDHGNEILSVAWQVCGTSKYLAIGGSGSGTSDGAEVRVLKFDDNAQTLSQVGSATFDHTADSGSKFIQSVAWQVCGTSKHLAIGGNSSSIDGAEVRVLKFDDSAQTLSQVGSATFDHGNEILSVAWQVCGDSTYLAIGGRGSGTSDGAEVRVLEFNGCVPQIDNTACNIIKKNHVSGTITNDTDGVGIKDNTLDSSTNHIYSNFSCKNDTNYNIGTQFPISAAQSKGVGETENIDCALEGTDDFEEIKFTVVDSAENAQANLGFTIADAAQSICSKLDLMVSGTVMVDLEAVKFTVCDKIEQATLCNPIPVTASTTIDTAGHYCLANDISGEVTITGTRVTLDLNRYTVNGTNNGIHVTGENTFVHNGTVHGASVGVRIEGDKNRLAGLDLVSNSTGVLITNANTNSIDGCRALCNTQAGFSLVNAERNCITNCKAIDTSGNTDAFGFVSTDGMCNIFDNNIAENTSTTGTDPFFAAGFTLGGNEQRSKIVHCQSGNTTGTDNAFGILLRAADALALSNVDTAAFSSTGVGWLVCDGTKYLSSVSTANGTDIRRFDTTPTGGTLTFIDSDSDADGENIDWLGKLFIPALSAIVQVYEFDPAGGASAISALTTATLDHGAQVCDAKWLVCGDSTYVAIGGSDSSFDGAEVRILEFDATTSLLSQVGSATFDHGGLILDIDWLLCGDSKYLAIGGGSGNGSARLRVLEFDATNEVLRNVESVSATANFVVPTWQVCNDTKYLATGDNAGTIRIYEFDTTTETLSTPVTFAGSNDVRSIDWLVCNNTKYLAVGTTGGSETQVLLFDDVAQTITEVADSAGATQGVAWQQCDDRAFLAIAGSTTRVLEFNGCVPAPCNIVKGNHATGTTTNNTSGVGIQDDAVLTGTSKNHIYSNFSCKNDTNYNIGTQFPISSAKSTGVGQNENLDCSLPGIDFLAKICLLDSKIDVLLSP